MIKRLRLATGLILFAYVSTHLLNHALGLISLQAQEDGRMVFLTVWRNPVGTVLVVGSLTIHLGLAFWSLYSRRTLRMHPWEAAQMLLGFAIPYFLVVHVVGTGLIHQLYGTNDTYAYINWVYWVADPDSGIKQYIVLVVAWLHACIGLYYWLRIRSWFRPLAPLLLAVAVLWPTLSLLGINQSGREMMELAKDPAVMRELIAGFRLPNNEQFQTALTIIETFQWAFLGMIALVFVARILRWLVQRVRGVVRVTYPDGRTADLLPGMSVLEASRASGIPHASVCGGRGRCSTCRVRVGEGASELSPPEPDEQKVLDRVGAPPNVRLACQLRPATPIEITPLLPPDASPRDAYRAQPKHQGHESEIAVLFADIRSFTKFSESKLPYDVVFVLNRYFESMGRAIREGGGHVDKFIGDGVMALFGIDTDPEDGCRAALQAAGFMSERLAELNRSLEQELAEPLRIGIGIHAGPAIVGEMGFGTATGLTAIGDTVNTASRLEAATKEFGAQLVVSEEVAALAGADLSAHREETITVRGREEPLRIHVVMNAMALLEDPDAPVGDPAPAGEAPATAAP